MSVTASGCDRPDSTRGDRRRMAPGGVPRRQRHRLSRRHPCYNRYLRRHHRRRRGRLCKPPCPAPCSNPLNTRLTQS